MQVTPSPELAHLVRHYLILEDVSAHELTYRFFPDGNPGLVFSFADPMSENVPQQSTATQHRNFAYGQVDQYYNLKAGKKVGLLVVVFHPWGLHSISGIAGAQTSNLRLSTADLFGPSADALQDQLMNETNPMSRIRSVEAFLLKLKPVSSQEMITTQRTVQAIQQTGGAISVLQLSQWINTSERGLERHFKYVMGISPKQFSRIIRLQHCLKIHRQQPATPFAQLAYSAGYYDQAHFIREFNQLAGLTPRQYVINRQRLAVNLMPLPG